MAVVTLDIQEGTASSHDLLSGWEYTRVAMVECTLSELPVGSSGIGSTDGLISYAQHYLSISVDTSPGVVLVNQPAPTTPGTVGFRGTRYQMMGNGGTYNQDGSANNGVFVYLKQFIPEVLSPTAVKFRIVYRGYPLLTYNLDGALTQTESNKDVHGNTIRLSYTYPANYIWRRDLAGSRFTISPLISRVLPEPVFTVKFLVTQLAANMMFNIRGNMIMLNVGTNATDAMTAIGAFSGTTNDDDYTIGIITGAKHTWMINVTAHSDDQGLTYTAIMAFHYRATGWDKQETIIDPNTGQPPENVIVSKVKVTDNTFPQYAGSDVAGTPDIGQTTVASADESTFPSFGSVTNATFPAVEN